MKTALEQSLSHENARKCVLYVCTSCRKSGTPREPKENRPGFILYQKLQESFKESPLKHRVEVCPTECLSICPRPCGIALSAPNAWTYLFGDQDPNETIQEILECASLYIDTPNGFMKRQNRPKSFRKGILGRIPPALTEV